MPPGQQAAKNEKASKCFDDFLEGRLVEKEHLKIISGPLINVSQTHCSEKGNDRDKESEQIRPSPTVSSPLRNVSGLRRPEVAITQRSSWL